MTADYEAAYARMIDAFVSILNDHFWVFIGIALLPAVAGLLFRSWFSAAMALFLVTLAILFFPGSWQAALGLWVAAWLFALVGGAFHIRYQQSEDHHRALMEALRKRD